MDAEFAVCNVDVVLFDFGGVLADEGFANGLRAIAQRHGLDETDFINLARDLIHRTGYITGRNREPSYWQAIRRPRASPGMMPPSQRDPLPLHPPPLDARHREKTENAASASSSSAIRPTGSMSSTNCTAFQTLQHRLQQLSPGEEQGGPTHFSDTISNLRTHTDRMLFIDDDEGHCERARMAGINAIRFAGREQFLADFSQYCPGDWTEHQEDTA
jgi:putative hydrolase of the HAD superfamily